MLPFNKPPYTGHEDAHVLTSMRSGKISGDGCFGKYCQKWFEEHLPGSKTLLTPSCTQALEMAALLIGIQPGDEVIMPSYTFVSTANAFVLQGAKIVFVDIRPDTLNIDEKLIEAAITPKTKAIVVVHYAGVACEMETICQLVRKHNLYLIEDAAQGVEASYRNKALGTFGHLAAFSFHETKNITSGGEGGLLIVNDQEFLARAEILREKGTNRSQFFRGMVDKYTWVDIGSSYLPSEIQAAYLWGQLEHIHEIQASRMQAWNEYWQGLQPLVDAGVLSLPVIPADCCHNAHMFYLKVKDLETRTALIDYLKHADILAVFHYVPLHSAIAGRKFGRFHGQDQHTTAQSERLLRLPLFYGIKSDETAKVIQAIRHFFQP